MEITMNGNNHPIEVDKAEVNVQRGMILGQLQIMKWVLGLMIAVMGGGFLLFHEAEERAHSERAEIRVSVAKLDERLIHMREAFDERMTNMEDRMTNMEDRMTNMEDRMAGMEDRMAGMEGRLTKVESDMTVMKNDMAVMKGDMTIMKGLLLQLVEQRENN